MEADSDDDFEQVSVPGDESDDDSDFSGSAARKNSTAAVSTPATTQGSTPFCREKRLKCPYSNCDKAFNRPTRLHEHMRTHTNERSFKCDHDGCTKDYFRASHLAHHIKSAHSDIRDYQCTYKGCDKAFATGQRMRVHLATHEAPNKYHCQGHPPCNQVFRKKETLQRHVQKVHENRQPFHCTKIDTRTEQPCTKAYETAAKLAAHVRSSHDPTRYSCELCMAYNDDCFGANSILHPDAKPAYFTTYAELQEHVTDQHPPSCPLCELSFHTMKELTRHTELIHGVLNPNSKPSKQVTCPHIGCGKVFTRTGNLNVHVRTTHENRRDFICGRSEISMDIPAGVGVNGCGRDFAHKAGLVDHVRTVHLGLDSMQKSKRKRQGEGQIPEPKKKKTRKDKGIRRAPAIARNTVEQERFPFYHEDFGLASGDTSPMLGDDLELDGNMTMYGSMLYDPDGAYRYEDGEYPAGSPYGQFQQQVSIPEVVTHDDIPRPGTPFPFEAPVADFKLDLPSNAFTLEPEMSNALDPMFLLSTPSQQRRTLSYPPRYD